MRKIDKTKKNIRIESISDNTRKELYDKFVEAGGEIIEEDFEIPGKTAKHGIFDRNKQAAYRKLLDSYKEKRSKNIISDKESDSSKNIRKESIKSYSEYKPNLLISFSQRLIIRLRLFFMNITDFSADTFNNKFFHLLNTEYKTALMGIKMLYLELFKQNKNIEYTLIYELDKINRNNTRLIENTSQIYNEDELNNITSDYKSSPESILPIIRYKNDIMSIFRKLYILKPYEHIIQTAFNSTIAIHMKLTGKKSSFYYKKKKNIKDDLYVIFEKLFHNLYWLICRYHNRIIPLGSFEFEKLLNIKTPKPTVKKIKTQVIEDIIFVDTDEEEIEKKEAEKKQEKEISDEIKSGLILMKDFTYNNIAKLRAEYDYTKTYNILKNNDKMLLTYIILQEFDIEYSFLLTTSKIKYKFDNKDSRDISLKEQLMDYYDDIKKCMNSIKEYSETCEIVNTITEEKLISNDRYIAHIKNLNAVSKRREQAANSARFSILNLMNNILSVFQLLIKDINGVKKYIEDPDERIDFDKSIEGNKQLNNKTIQEALSIAYNFASAYAFRLTMEGDLSGPLEFDTTNEKDNNDNIIPDEVNDSASSDETSDAKEKEGEEKSIIDEIDDMFTE